MELNVGSHTKSSPFHRGPSSTGLFSIFKRPHESYAESKLIWSGDIETQPGPQKLPHIHKVIVLLLITFTVLLTIAISFYNIKATENSLQQQTVLSPASITTKQSLLSARNLLTFQKKKRKEHIKVSTLAAYLAFILLMAGDIHPNPGPTTEHCLLCKQSDNNIQSLTCDTCRGWCHISCTGQKNYQTGIKDNTSYQWHCPNPKCLPNHQKSTESQLTQSPNRYNILTKKNKSPENRKSKQKNKTNMKTATKQEIKNREICKACRKTIAKNQRAISCDKCPGLTHQKCSDMSLKIYKSYKDEDFPWVCNTCREPDDIEPKTDIKKLKPEETPIVIDQLTQHNDEFLILHYNCQSILNKAEELHRICMKLKPKIICLTETWLDASTKTANMPDGYKILRCDRTDTYKQKYGKTGGGGTAVIYREDIKIRKLNINSDDQETQWVEVKANQIFTIGIVYRTDYNDLLDEKEEGMPLEGQLYEASIRSKRIITIGDFNCDLLKDEDQKDDETKRLEDMFERFSMKQLITKPTRINKSNKTTIIDHIWTDTTTLPVKESGTIEEIGKSDHTGIYVKLDLATEKTDPEKVRYRNYRDYNTESFNKNLEQELTKSDFIKQIDRENLDEAMDTFTKIFKETAQKHAPMIEKVKKKKKQNVPWFVTELDLKIEEKNKKLQLYRLYGNKKDLESANKLGNEITHLKRKLKRKYYKQKIEEYEGDSKKMWKILKDVTQTTPDKDCTEPDFLNQDKANQYNKYFATIGTVVQRLIGTKDADPISQNEGKFHFKEETEETIIKLIDRIKEDVATGEDEISAKLIKDTKHTIAGPLTKLVNLSYKRSTFPKSMKVAVIKALHKKNCTEDISNYRPLSILSVLSKIFERSATDQIVKYLEENGLLNSTQHAYRRKHSTTTCLMEAIDYINEQRDKGKIVGLASLDLSKAFDSINHSHLLNKLANFGLDKNTLKWCKSYLHQRKQKTKFKKFTSTEHIVTSGVPQGSILGPIFFICFTNDMPNYFSNCKIISYADDTQIIIIGDNIQQVKLKLEEIIKLAQKWYNENSLMNNASKTEILIIGKPNTKEQSIVYIAVEESGEIKLLKPKKTIKVLGVHIDDQLNWNTQIQAVRKKAMYSIRNLYRINQLIPLKHRLLLYNSLVATHYNYADTAWAGCGIGNEKKLQTTQNFAARSILGWKKRTSATEALETLKFLPLKQKRKVHEAVYVHKALNDKLPKEICNKYRNQLSTQNLRSTTQQTLNIPAHKTQKYQQCPMFRTIKAWNDTTVASRTELITNTFKKQYQARLLNAAKS